MAWIAFLPQAGQGDILSIKEIRSDLHPQIEDPLDLLIQDLLGQAVFRDGIPEHPAQLGLGIEYGHLMTSLPEIISR